jgi:hypothetical protein
MDWPSDRRSQYKTERYRGKGYARNNSGTVRIVVLCGVGAGAI